MDWPFFASRWRLCSAHHRSVDCCHHGLGLVEVSRLRAPLHRRLCVSVLRSSLLLWSPTYALQSSSRATCSTSSVNCCELVDRPERRFGSVARARCLESSLSSGTTSRRPYEQLHRQFLSHFGNPRSQLEGRNADYNMYSTCLTASSGSVLFSRSNLLKRKDLCFSCLRLGLIRHRRSLRSSHLSSQVCHDSHRVTLDEQLI
jgi:hypothetical protein